MPSLGSKKDIQKRDLNFFAEFTAAAAKMTRMLGYGVVVGIIVVALIVGVIVWGFIRNMITQSQIDELRATLESDEYKNLDAEAAELRQQLSSYNNYYYALSQMRGQVDTVKAVSMNLTDTVKKSVPNDTYIDKYSITQTGMTVQGYTFSYYSALNLVKKLNDTGIFATPVTLGIERVDPSTIGTVETFITSDGKVNAINNYYSFTVEGSLTSKVYVKVSKFLKDKDTTTNLDKITNLSVEDMKELGKGESMTLENIATYTQGNVTYTLTGITVNKASLAKETVESVVKNGKYIISTASSSEGVIDVQLTYSFVENQQQGG